MKSCQKTQRRESRTLDVNPPKGNGYSIIQMLKMKPKHMCKISSREGNKVGVGEALGLYCEEEGKIIENTNVSYSVLSGNAEIVGDKLTVLADGKVQVSAKKTDEAKDDLELTVVKPSENVTFTTIKADNGHFGNNAGAGFIGDIPMLNQKSVSFDGLQIREGTAKMQTSGVFDKEKDRTHAIGAPFGVINNKVQMKDTIHTCSISKEEFKSAGKGEQTWDIPWQYSVKDKEVWIDFTKAKHHGVIDESGTVIVAKLNGSDTREAPFKNEITPKT